MRVRAGCEYSLTRALRRSLPHACFHCTAVASWAEVMLCEKGSRAEAVGCSAASCQALCGCIEDHSKPYVGRPKQLEDQLYLVQLRLARDLPMDNSAHEFAASLTALGSRTRLARCGGTHEWRMLEQLTEDTAHLRFRIKACSRRPNDRACLTVGCGLGSAAL